MGPDVAVYEAVFASNGIHVGFGDKWELKDPANPNIKPVWDAMLNSIKDSKKRINVSTVYDKCKLPPFGMKDGIAAIFMSAILLIHKNQIALYEHGTYIPYMIIEIVERMIKNPDHFAVKYFQSTPVKKKLLKTVVSAFEINSAGSVLDVVSHMVRIVSALEPYTKQTKHLDKHSIAVRNTIQNAVEPDTLLFESLPQALGFNPLGPKTSQSDIQRFSDLLAKSISILQKNFRNTMEGITFLLFSVTGIETREKLSKASGIMSESVSDKKMQVFLGALATDTLERNEDWINYVALSLTDIPPMSWKDEQKVMFENNLKDMLGKFQRLASIHFAKTKDSFAKPSYQVTVTSADGSEQRNVVSIKPENKKKIEVIVENIIKDMKKQKLTKRDIGSLVALLSAASQKV